MARTRMVIPYDSNPKYPGRKCGTLIINSEEVVDVKGKVTLEFFARNLDKKDLFGKSDPFLRISRVREDGSLDAVHKTEVVKSNLNPSWQRFTISLQSLCNGDLQRPLIIQCFDWNKSGKEDLIGQCQTTLVRLQQMYESREAMDLVNPAKAGKKKYSNSGVLNISYCSVNTTSFLDYIRGGLEINLLIAIDFTASNGNPSDPKSLHYTADPSRSNDYVRAIQSVATVLSNYDTDQRYPVWGFGARLPPNGVISHCFPLNGNTQDPSIAGIENVIAGYMHTIRNIQLFGPTNFSQVLDAAAHSARSASNQYTILLILTDGVISDMDDTVDRIVAASGLPLSIVIVGVGNADFKLMERLDADTAPLTDRKGRKMTRDIVQFVPMRDFVHAHPSRIAEVTLEEIPSQIIEYMTAKGIKPQPPIQPPSLAHLPSVGLPYPPVSSPNMPSSAPYPLSSPSMPSAAPYPPTSPNVYPPTSPSMPSTAPYPPPYSPPSTAPYPSSSSNLPYPPQN